MVATCKLGEKGCWKDGKCRVNDAKCENRVVTNADRIRSMTDEKLAELFYGFCWNGEHCYSCPLFEKDCAGIGGADQWKAWMKKPVEVE